MKDQFPYEKIKRGIIIRKESETNPKYGCNPENRKTRDLINYGVVNIDKPSGPTSHQISDYVQKILDIDKAGHSGTLDPKVTGSLPIALGRATRIVQLLLKAGKEYVGVMHLHKEFEEEELNNVVSKFVGKIEQVPPLRSSVKRRKRERSVYYFNILEIEEKDVLFRVGCQAGTYIRKLVHDLGKKFGKGAHMSELRRTRVGPFDESSLVTLQDLIDAFYYYKKEENERFLRCCIQPIEKAIVHIPKIWVMDSAVDSLCHGASLKNPGIVRLESGIKKEDIVAVLTLKGELVCYGNAAADSNQMLEEKGLAVKSNKVFMLPGTYPKIEK